MIEIAEPANLDTDTMPKIKPPGNPDQATDSALAPETRVLRQFRIVFNAVKTHFRQVEKQAGMGGAQVWALSVIQDQPGIGLNDLAHAMDVHQSTASNLVKTLLERQLISTAKGSQDRRAICLFLTPEGSAALGNAPAPFAGVLPIALSSLDAPTLERLEQDLHQLIIALHADEASAKIPLAEL